jgi:hypothetical protein
MSVRSLHSIFCAAVLGGLLAAAVAGATSSVARAEAKLITGAACSFTDGFAFAAHDKSSQFFNLSGSTRGVVCPIVKDSIGGNLNAVSLLTSQFPFTQCNITRRPFIGGGLAFFAPANVTNNGNGTQYINWSSIPAPATSVAVVCSLPTSQTILSVQYDEPE